VANDLVDTDADTLRESVVVERGRIRVPLDALLVADPIELVTGNAWSDMRCRCIQYFSRELDISFMRPHRLGPPHPADLAHRLDLLLVQRLNIPLPDHFARRHTLRYYQPRSARYNLELTVVGVVWSHDMGRHLPLRG